MAVTSATTLSDFAGFIKPEMAEQYFQEVRKRSVVQQTSRQVPLGYAGAEVPVVTTKPTAAWVSEAGQKPASKGSMVLKTISPKKIAAIAIVSSEVVRANPGNYVNIFREDIAEAFAMAFDSAALHGVATPFGAGNYIGATTKEVGIGTASQANGGIFADVNAGLALLVNDGRRLNGFVLDATLEPDFNSSVDNTGRPLFVDSPLIETAGPIRAGRLLGRNAFFGEDVSAAVPATTSTEYHVGFGGNFLKSVWGVVGGISYDISTQASVTINGSLVSLFENNLVAIRAEAEYGWLCNDPEEYVAFTKTTAA